MMSVDVSEPFVEGDIAFDRVTINGGQFIMHQIRKIIECRSVHRGFHAECIQQRSSLSTTST